MHGKNPKVIKMLFVKSVIKVSGHSLIEWIRLSVIGVSHLINKHIRITANSYIIRSIGQSGKTIDSFKQYSICAMKINPNYTNWRKKMNAQKNRRRIFSNCKKLIIYVNINSPPQLTQWTRCVCSCASARLSKTRIFLWILHAPFHGVRPVSPISIHSSL